MEFAADTLDDLLRDVLDTLVKSDNVATPTKGQTREHLGVLLTLHNPRARLSRTERKGTVFSCLGELMWYLAGSNDLEFIRYYVKGYEKFSDDGVTVHGAYGPRLFNMRGFNQINSVVTLLKGNPVLGEPLYSCSTQPILSGDSLTSLALARFSSSFVTGGFMPSPTCGRTMHISDSPMTCFASRCFRKCWRDNFRWRLANISIAPAACISMMNISWKWSSI